MAEAVRVSGLQEIAQPAASGQAPGVVLRERRGLVMLDLRAPAQRKEALDGIGAALGCALPLSPNASSTAPDGEILRLGPDEWLLVAEAPSRWSETMPVGEGTLTDVSHARVVVAARGARVTDALAKGCAVDLHPGRFPPGMCIQTAIARIHVILHRTRDEFVLYAPRSYARSFWHWLTQAAAEYGCHVLGP